MMPNKFIFAIISFILLSINLEAQSNQSEVLYAELAIYRSKVDKTESYLRKLEMIETAWIEKWDKSLLEERISAIDTKPNESFGEALGLASMLPGWYGKAAKGLKIYDYGARTIKGATDKTASIINFEDQVRETVGRLMDFVAKDPKLAKTVNAYLGKEFGDINGKPSEIAGHYPPFQDHLTIIQLKEMLKNQNKENEEVKKLLNQLQSQFAKMEEAANKEIAYETKLQDINEWYTYGTLVSRLVSLKNPQLGHQINLAVTSYQRGATIAAAFSNKKMTAGLASANYALLALDMISMLSNEPSPEQQILEGLANLQNLIIEQTERVLEAIEGLDVKVDEINRKIDILYDEILANRALIVGLHNKVNQLQDEHFFDRALLTNAVRAGFDRELKNIINESIGKKQAFKPGTYTVSKELFDNTLQRLHLYATDHLKDQLANPALGTFQTPEKLLDELAAVPQLANLSFISSFLLKNGIASTYNTQMDASMWVQSASALIELVTDWPEYQAAINPNIIKQVFDMGFGIEKFGKSCSFSNNPTLYINLIKKIKETNLRQSQLIKNEVYNTLIKDQSNVNILLNNNFDLNTMDNLSSVDLVDNFFSGSIVKSIPMKTLFASGSWRHQNLDLPQSIKTLLPAHIKSAYQAGDIDLSANYYTDHGGAARVNDTLVVFASVKSDGIKYRIIERNYFYPHCKGNCFTIAGFGWGSSTPQQSAEWYIDNILIKQKSVDFSNNFLTINQKTKDSRLNYLNRIWFASIQNLEATTEFRDNSKILDGYYDLLIHLVSIGHSESFSKNDTLENLLFNQKFRTHNRVKRLGISSNTISTYNTEFSKWNDDILNFLANDKANQKLPYIEITALLNELNTLQKNMEKGETTRSPFAKERHIAKQKKHFRITIF